VLTFVFVVFLNPQTATHNILREEERLGCLEYQQLAREGRPHLLVDVREKVQFDICSIPNSQSKSPSTCSPPFEATPPVSLSDKKNADIPLRQLSGHLQALDQSGVPIFFVCRRGNDSQKAVRLFKEAFPASGAGAMDLVGGLQSWATDVDPSFPVY